MVKPRLDFGELSAGHPQIANEFVRCETDETLGNQWRRILRCSSDLIAELRIVTAFSGFRDRANEFVQLNGELPCIEIFESSGGDHAALSARLAPNAVTREFRRIPGFRSKRAHFLKREWSVEVAIPAHACGMLACTWHLGTRHRTWHLGTLHRTWHLAPGTLAPR